MEIKDIQFQYDLTSKIFGRIEIFINIYINKDEKLNEIKEIILSRFQKIENHFDEKFLKIPGISKNIGGSEYSTFLHAGYNYQTEKIFKGVNCKLEYNFGIRKNKLEIPTINISLEIPHNMNYWFFENLIGEIGFKFSNHALKTLERMRLKAKSDNVENDPKSLLVQFSNFMDNKYQNDEKGNRQEKKIISMFIPMDMEIFSKSKSIMESGLKDLVKETVKKDKDFFPFNKFFYLKTALLGSSLVIIIYILLFYIEKLLKK